MMDEYVVHAEEAARQVLFLFHGYGSDNRNLEPVGRILADAVPGMEVRLPRGIEPCEEGFGRQWFSLPDRDLDAWYDNFLKSAPIIMSYIDKVLADKNMTYADAIIAGFSQGGMISLSLGMKYAMKGIISFSGYLMSEKDIRSDIDTKVLLCHGGEDTVVPLQLLDLTENQLKSAGISVSKQISPSLGHAIDKFLLESAVDFLRQL